MPGWVPALPAARPAAFTSRLPERCPHPLPSQLRGPTLSSSAREGCVGLGQGTHQPVTSRFVGVWEEGCCQGRELFGISQAELW